MRKFLALLLSMLLIIGMFAGCSKKETEGETTTPQTTEKVEAPTEGVGDSDDSIVVTVPPDVINPDIENKPDPLAKASFWKDVFVNNGYKFLSNSFDMEIGGKVGMKYLEDKQGCNYMEISGILDGQKMGVGFLEIGEDKTYYHKFGGESSGSGNNVWYLCTNVSKENGNVSVNDDMTEFEDALGKIQNVEFVESNGNVDKIKIYYLAAEENDESENVLLHDDTVIVEYNGQTGKYRVQVYENGVSSQTLEEIEGFHWLDYDYDREKLTLTNDDVVINVKIEKNHMEDETTSDSDGLDGGLEVIDVEINAKTLEIVSMAMESEGMLTAITFLKCDDVVAAVGPLNNVENIDHKNAVEQFAGTMMAIMFSMMAENN